MSRGDSLRRQWSLVQMLQSHRFGCTLDELADRLACTRRTIQRDINILRQVGLPIAFNADGDQHGQRRYSLPHGYLDRSELLLTITEALSLYLAKAFMAPLAGTSIGQAFDHLFRRIEQTLSDKTLHHFRDLQGLLLVLSPGQPDPARYRDSLAAVDAAVRERRILKVTYYSQWRGERYTTEIHPYGLVFWQGDFYAVAFSCHAGAIRVFKLTRIQDAQLTSRTFSRPADFDLEEYFSPSMSVMRAGPAFEACVRFTGPAVSLAQERRCHPSQRVVSQADGCLVVKVRLSDPVGLKQWVKSFGPHAELLSPRSLRDELGEELAASAALYSRPAAGVSSPF